MEPINHHWNHLCLYLHFLVYERMKCLYYLNLFVCVLLLAAEYLPKAHMKMELRSLGPYHEGPYRLFSSRPLVCRWQKPISNWLRWQWGLHRMSWGILCDARKDGTTSFWKDRGTAKDWGQLELRLQIPPAHCSLSLISASPHGLASFFLTVDWVLAHGEKHDHWQLLSFPFSFHSPEGTSTFSL